MASKIEKMVDQKIPKPPRIYSVDFKVFTNDILGDNTIMISRDIADILEKDIENAKL